jgi:hypothetical protein
VCFLGLPTRWFQLHPAHTPPPTHPLICPQVPAGAPLLLNYGALSNDFLLMDYGFILPGNPNDRVALRFDIDLLEVGRGSTGGPVCVWGGGGGGGGGCSGGWGGGAAGSWGQEGLAGGISMTCCALPMGTQPTRDCMGAQGRL